MLGINFSPAGVQQPLTAQVASPCLPLKTDKQMHAYSGPIDTD